MERQIKQTYAPVWRLMRLIAIPVVVFLIAVAGILYYNGQRDVMRILSGVAIMAVALLPMLLLIVFVVSGCGSKWFVTDAGLKWVQLGNKTRTIPWEKIYHMQFSQHGLFIRWSDNTPIYTSRIGPPTFEHRAILYPAPAEADELIALWQQKTPRESQTRGRAHTHAMMAASSRQVVWMSIGMIIVGLLLIGFAGVDVVRLYSSSSWPQADGKMISEYYYQLPYDSKHREQDAQLTLTYEYQVDGQSYRSQRYKLWGKDLYQDDDTTIRAFEAGHQHGAPVKVYYDPKNPATGVLLPGPNWRGDGAFVVFGSFLIFIGFIFRLIVLNRHHLAKPT